MVLDWTNRWRYGTEPGVLRSRRYPHRSRDQVKFAAVQPHKELLSELEKKEFTRSDANSSERTESNRYMADEETDYREVLRLTDLINRMSDMGVRYEFLNGKARPIGGEARTECIPEL